MTAWVWVLVIVALVVFFALGYFASRLVRESQGRTQSPSALSSATDLVPARVMLPVETSLPSGMLGYASQGGIEVIAERLPADVSASRGRAARRLSASSAISSELGRLASIAPSVLSNANDVYRVTVRDAGGGLMKAAGGGYHGDVVNALTGRIEGKAILQPLSGSSEVLGVLGPQAVWGLAAFAVGQHFEAEVTARLDTIDKKLDRLIHEIGRERLAELDAASRECERAAYRILEGGRPTEVLTGLSAQKLFIDKNWSIALGGIASAEKKLAELQGADGLTASKMVEIWEELFGQDVSFWGDLRLFLSALAAKMKLISLLAIEDAANRDVSSSAGAYRLRLEDEMSECGQAVERVRSVLRGTMKLDYSLEWTSLGVVSKGKKEKTNRIHSTMGTLLGLEDDLNRLHLPFAGSDSFPQYDLLAERMSDGSLELGVTRIVTPTISDLS